MATNLGDLVANVQLNTSGFRAGINRISEDLKKINSGVNGLGMKFVKLNQFIEVSKNVMYAFNRTVGALAKTFLQAADVSEGYRIRLNQTLGSVQEGSRMFKEMSEFAASVPFEFEHIMRSATDMSAVMNGGVEEVRQWMGYITDLAALTGLTVRDTTSQIIRMYSAGAGSADMFRERGVLAMMGFSAGVSYTATETRERLIKMAEDPLGKIKGMAKELAKTWTGQISMIKDKWFLFRQAVMDMGMFEGLKQVLISINHQIDEMKENGQMESVVKEMSDLFVDIGEKLVWAAGQFTAIALAAGAVFHTMFGYVHKYIIGPIINAASQVIATLIKGVGEILLFMGRGFSQITQVFGDSFLAIFDGLKKILPESFGDTIDKVKESVKNINDGTFFVQIGEDIVETSEKAKKFGEDSMKVGDDQIKLGGQLNDVQYRTIESAEKLNNAYRNGIKLAKDQAAERLKAAEKTYLANNEALNKEEQAAWDKADKAIKKIKTQIATAGFSGLQKDIIKARHEYLQLMAEFGFSDVTDEKLANMSDARKSLLKAITDVYNLKLELADTTAIQTFSDRMNQLNFSKASAGLNDYEYGLAEINNQEDIYRRKKEASGETIDRWKNKAVAAFNAVKEAAANQQTEDLRFDTSQLGFSDIAQEINKIGYEYDKLVSEKMPDSLKLAYAETELAEKEFARKVFSEDLGKQIRTITFEMDTSGLDDYSAAMKRIDFEVNNMLKGLKEDDPLRKQIEAFRDAKKAAESYSQTIAQVPSNIQLLQGALVEFRDVGTSALTDFFNTWMETGKMDWSELGNSLAKGLQMHAAAMTAELLMRAIYHKVMFLVSVARRDPVAASDHMDAFVQAGVGAGIMGSYVTGAGLAGMAHDGMTDIPKEGTWLLDKGERVVDSDTNKDLKKYLKNGGSNEMNINMPVTIQGGDEQSVMKALPQLKRTIEEVVTQNIASNGSIRRTISSYS
jgi:methyl-accepting chemotaxis protein